MSIRKKLLPTLILPLILGIASAETIEKPTKETLHPDLVEMAKLKPLTDDFFEENLFVDLYGINFPRENYREIAEKVIRHNYQTVKNLFDQGEAIFDSWRYVDRRLSDYLEKEEKMLKFHKGDEGFEVIFPCSKYNVSQCIELTHKNRNEIEQLQDEERVLIQRYRILTDRNHYREVSIDLYDDLDFIRPFARLHHWSLAKAILAFYDGESDHGLEILENQQKLLLLFTKKESRIGAIQAMLNVNFMQSYDQTLDALLSDGYLDDQIHSESVEKLFQPNADAKKEMALKAIRSALINELCSILMLMREKPLELTPKEQIVALEWLLTQTGEFFFHLDSARYLNPEQLESRLIKLKTDHPQLAKEINEWVDEERYLSHAKHEAYLKEQGFESDEIVAHYFSFDFPNNINREYQFLIEWLDFITTDFTQETLEQFLAEKAPPYRITSPRMIEYLYRMEEQNNYHNLVHLKYLIKRDQIADENIPHFLESMGDLAKNRITKESFLWDAEKRMLSTLLQKESKYRPASVEREETHWIIDL